MDNHELWISCYTQILHKSTIYTIAKLDYRRVSGVKKSGFL